MPSVRSQRLGTHTGNQSTKLPLLTRLLPTSHFYFVIERPNLSRNPTNPFNYRSLEDRRLLTVSTSLSAGTLSIFGDAAANTVSIRASGSSLLISGDISEQFSISQVTEIRFFGADGDDFFQNFTNINTRAVGNDGNDELRTAGGTDVLLGGDGDDLLVSTGGDDRLIGNNGNDTLFGGIGNDTIFGIAGDDELHGEAGDDRLVAGFGDDTVFGGNGDDLVFGHFGNDQIFGQGGDDLLFGQSDDDTIEGGPGNDTVRGGLGDDFLRGNTGDDRALGDEGDDDIEVGDGDDVVFGGAGDDVIRGGEGNDRLFANEGDDEVFGEAGNDILRGNDGNDTLFGGDNADRVDGDAGDDRLDGGGASDAVLGDLGDDTIIGDTSDRAIGGAGDDLIQLGAGGTDSVTFAGNFANYVVTSTDGQLVVRDTTGADGLDRITGAESFVFSDGSRAAAAQVTQQVFVQPIVVSDDNGSNTAIAFGNDEQAFEIRRQIDEIYLQAGIDIVFLDERNVDSTFFNFGNGGGERTDRDLENIIDQGDRDGIGNSDRQVIDTYFVNRVPGFRTTSRNTSNGLAFVGDAGIAIHTGDNLLNFASGRSIIAEVTAHEIAHNLGLEHVADSNNLLGDGDQLNASQISAVRSSQFSQTFNAQLSANSISLDSSGDVSAQETTRSTHANLRNEAGSSTGGCGGCGCCAACTGATI